MTGNLTLNSGGNIYINQTSATSLQFIRFMAGDNDYGRIAFGATGNNVGYLEIATADDGSEPIYLRQYTELFINKVREAVLLDSSGNTQFPGTVQANYFTCRNTTLCNNLNADLLDGYNESVFLRYRGGANTAGENTLWSQIGIKEYNGFYPDGLTNGIYDYGAVISLPSASARLDIWYNHGSTDQPNNGLQYRSGWSADKKPWRMILDSVNYYNYADSRYVKKSGDTMTGTLSMKDSDRSITEANGVEVIRIFRNVIDGYVAGIPTNRSVFGKQGLMIHAGTSFEIDFVTSGWNSIIGIECSTGNIRLKKGQIQSLVSTGTAPFSVNSRTMVANLNANFLDGKQANEFTSIIGRQILDTNGTAPYNYIWLFRVANSNGYSTLRLDFDFKTRYHAATLYIDIETSQYPYNSGGSAIRIFKETKAGRTCPFYVKQTIQSSGYNYYDVYYYSGNWNYGSYDIKLRGINGSLVYEAKNQKLDSLPSGCSEVAEADLYGNASSARQLYTSRTIFGQPFNGTQNVGGLMTSSSVFINAGDETLKIYGGMQQNGISDGNICMQTSIDGTDGQTHSYPTMYPSRCNLCLQPRGGQVYIGQNPNGGNTAYKLVVKGSTLLTETNSINFGSSSNMIRNSGNDNGNEVGNSTLSNIVISSWYGVSFTTTCSSTYQNRIAMSVNCRTGRVTAHSFHAAGDITANGAITAKASSSDIRLKRDIKDFSAMDILRKIQPKQFYWNELAKANSPVLNNNNRQYGLIAQSIQDIPELEGFVDNVFKDYLIIHYEKFIPIALEGIREVDDEVTKLKRKVATLQERIAILEGKSLPA